MPDQSPFCQCCDQLDRDYQCTIQHINAAVHGPFKTVDEKLRELFRWQDARDTILRTLYEHKKSHKSARRGASSTGGLVLEQRLSIVHRKRDPYRRVKA
jgi:hypothetical protein